MKIHQLPMGARFSYEGVEYVKTGPQIGSGQAGQRLIPKYAVLQCLDGSAPASAPAPFSREDVHAAFERFYAQCAALVPPEKQAELAAARTDFLRALA